MAKVRDDKAKSRVKRPLDRRKSRPRIVITVTEPGQIVIDQGKREDHIDAPPGTTFDRPPRQSLTQGDKKP